MAALCERFMKEYAPGHLKPSTVRLYRKIIDNRILPRLGKRRVSHIGKNDVAGLHHEMRDVPGHANRTLSVLSRMMTLAEVWEMRPEGAQPVPARQEVSRAQAGAVSLGRRVPPPG